MIKRVLLSFIILISFSFVFSYAQTLGKIKGTIQMEDRTKLPGVTVSIQGKKESTVTDKDGEYTFIGVSQGEVTLIASLDGFATQVKIVIVQAGRTVLADFTLGMSISEESTVTAEKPLLSASDKVSKITLTPSQIETLPSLGEKDIFRAFQLLPGIMGSQETSSGLFVRGGTPDQNLILYDGFTIFHVDHLYGYFSAFNMEAINEVNLHKGGFESKYGGRLSSVMELSGKNGNEKKLCGGAGISLLSLNGLAEIPLFNKGSLFIAGRRSFQSPLYNDILGMFDNTPGPGGAQGRPGGGGQFGGGGRMAMFDTQPSSYFYDLNAKLVFNPSPKDLSYLSLYNGQDKIDNSRELNIPAEFLERMAERGFDVEGDINITDLQEYGNTGVGTNWSRTWSSNFQSSILLTYSNYINKRDRSSQGNFGRPEDDEEEDEDDTPRPRFRGRGTVEDNNIEDITFRLDNSILLPKSHTIEFGVQITQNDIQYSFEMDEVEEEDEEDTDDGPRNLLGILNRDDKGVQYSAYLQDRWTVFDRLTITPGVRATYFDQTGQTFFEPRFSFTLGLTNEISLKGAWGKYHQIVNMITREDIMQGNREFWVLSDGETIPFGSATHYIAGISFETDEFLFDIEGYYKDLNGLSEFSIPFTPTRLDQDVDYNQYFYTGTGIANGIEFLLQKKYGKYTGWLGYTLGKVEYNFPDLKEDPYPALHDQTHEFKVVNSYEWNDWTFSGTWILATGKPYTEPIGVEEVTLSNGFVIDRVVAGEKNGARLPDYHRLDLSVTYDFSLGGETNSVLGLTLFNVYNRKNVWYKEFEVLEGELIENNIIYMGFTVNVFFSIKF
ncbi:MAG: TonB-dependent receptor [Candidatus Aminicenantes bacterium]